MPNGNKSSHNGNQVASKKNRKRGKGGNGVGPGMGSSLNVAGAAYAKNLASRFDVMPTSRAGSLRVRGQDFLCTLRTPGTINAGTNLAVLLVNPIDSAFTNTRLQAYGRLYEKWIAKDIKFHYQPAVASTANGQIVLAYDRDVADETPPEGAAGVHQYLAMAGARTTQVWQPCTIECPLTDTQDFYYTNFTGVGDLRLSHQGQFYVANVVGAIPNSDIGNIWIEYDITLYDPQLESPVTEAAAQKDPEDATIVIRSPTSSCIWNNIVPDAKNNRHGLKFFPKQTEYGGIISQESFFDLPGGVYALLQMMTNVNDLFAWSPVTFFPNISGQQIVETVLSTVNPAGGDSVFRFVKLLIPDGGGRIFQFIGADPGATISASNLVVKLLDLAGFEVY